MTARFEERARDLVAGARITLRRPAIAADLAGEPPDLAALWAACDGLELDDGTRVLGREEAAKATAWLVEEHALDWDPDLRVVGERDDLVIVRDVDRAGARAGGGVLEAPTDGLRSFRRAARDVIGYLALRAGAEDPRPAPERAAREAVARGDAAALSAALAEGFYPGAERELAHAALSLGTLLAGAGDAEGAMDAFARSAEARARSVPRGAGPAEAQAAWRAAAIALEGAGAPAIAEACRARAAEPIRSRGCSDRAADAEASSR